jgi:hypothetical protein
MQFEITDVAAAAFARGDFTVPSLADAVSMTQFSAGRIAILGTSSRTLEWITPVLYLRGYQAKLFGTA